MCIVMVLANNTLQRATLQKVVDTSRDKSDAPSVRFLFYGKAFGVPVVGDYCEQSPAPENSKTNYPLAADKLFFIAL